MKQAFQLIQKKQIVAALVLVLVPMGWNACGKKTFGSSAYDSKDQLFCAAHNIDLAECQELEDGESSKGMSQSVEVKANKNVDILFVVDNSGSMSEEQIGIGNKIDGFLDKIKTLNWQIAITTTDAQLQTKDKNSVLQSWGDGQFRKMDNADFIKSTNTTAASAQTKLAAAIEMGTNGSGDERGINATYRAIERSTSASNPQHNFFRSDARLAVVVISDEDECSTGLAACPNYGSSVPQNLLNLVQQDLGSSKVFSFNSIVLDSSCSTSGNKGNTYMSLSDLTGGAKGAVCATDYTTPLTAIANNVINLIKSIPLSCPALDVTKDGVADLAIMDRFGGVKIEGFTISGTTVTLDEPLPEGTYDLYYYCAE